jgi:hypothetical protein
MPGSFLFGIIMTDEEATRIATAVEDLAAKVAQRSRFNVVQSLEVFIKEFRGHHSLNEAEVEAQVDQAFNDLVKVLTEVNQ